MANETLPVWRVPSLPGGPLRWDAVPSLPLVRAEDGGADEFTAWSPTLARPADFHRPARFGFLALVPY